jgi:hypothetical protein
MNYVIENIWPILFVLNIVGLIWSFSEALGNNCNTWEKLNTPTKVVWVLLFGHVFLVVFLLIHLFDYLEVLGKRVFYKKRYWDK